MTLSSWSGSRPRMYKASQKQDSASSTPLQITSTSTVAVADGLERTSPGTKSRVPKLFVRVLSLRFRNSWCDPFKTWQKSYSFDPFANLTSEQQKLILGGESLLWTEQSSPENLDPIVWPRAASAAEIYWTGATLPDGKVRNDVEGVRAALPRLHDVAYRMRRRGIRAIALQPEWCARRPGACDVDA